MSFSIRGKNKKYCFLHIPKNGGKSIIYSLEGKGLAITRPIKKHATFLETKEIIKTEDKFFCAIRNPFERMISYYCYIKQRPIEHGQARAKAIADFRGFESFVDYVRSKEAPNVFRPQFDYITSDNKTINENIHFLRVENLQEDFSDFIQKERITDKPISLKHINKSERLNPRCYYTNNKIIDKVIDFEKAIFERFDYPKTLHNEKQ